MPDFATILPECFMATMICLIVVVDVFLKDSQRHMTYILSQATLVGAAYFSFQLMGAPPKVAMSGLFISDSLAQLLKIVIYGLTLVAFVYSRTYILSRHIQRGEYYILGLSSVLGMMVLVSAANLLSIYLGLEILSLSLYALVAIRRDSKMVAEAAMKYFVMGALASGMLLYGMSMLYGITGTIQIAEIAVFIAQQPQPSLVLGFGLVFIVVALAFKIGAVPFHMWVPDVYHGAPTSVTAIISTAPKLAAFGMIIRLLHDALPQMQGQWQDMLLMLAMLSIMIGNLIAISQTNIKRLLAYSAIAHMGFFLLGIIAGTPEGYSSSLFYIITYAIMSLGAFGVVILMSREGFEAEEINDLKGLNARSPWYAFIMMLLMFSMAGVPPTVGFYAKLSVLKAVVDIDMVWLAGFAVFFSIIGAYYYLRVVKTLYFDAPDKEMAQIEVPKDMAAVISVNGLLILALGLFPSMLMSLCQSIF